MPEPILILPAWLTATLGTVGLGAGAITMAPQISKIVNDKSAKGTSWAMAAINGFGTSILLGFCGATVSILGVGPIALGLGITTLSLAAIRTVSGITLIGMKYYYDYKYLNNKINEIKNLINQLSEISKTPNKYLLDLINHINETRSQNIGKRTISNKQVGELKKEAIEDFIKIINYLEEKKSNQQYNPKEIKIMNQIKKEITNLFSAGKHYQNTSHQMKTLIDQNEKINEIFKKLIIQNDSSIQTKLNNLNKQIDNFKELIKQHEELKKQKSERMQRNIISRGIKKFSKDTIPFAFGNDSKKLNKKISNKMNEIPQSQEKLKEILDFISNNHFNKLDENDKKIFLEIASELYSKEIELAIKNGELAIIHNINCQNQESDLNAKTEYKLKTSNSSLFSNIFAFHNALEIQATQQTVSIQ
jgi:hypothetical protein